jgi:serine/threonine-protein kinase
VADLEGVTLDNGHYRLDRLLGSGGQGTVYKGTHLTLNISVAIKVLPFSRNEAMRKRFTREAQRAASLRHANIVGVLDYEYDSDLDTYYIVSEFIDGTDLKRLMARRGGPLPPDEVARYMVQVGAALQFAHDQNIIHRDIKPGNILLEQRTGRIVLCDFGLARMVEGEVLDVTSATGVKPGTPAYMSPEQCMGQNLDHRTDIYSLGIVVYEMLTGLNPFRGANDTSDSIRYKHIHEAPPPPRELNPALGAGMEVVLLRAIEKDPARRFRSVSEFVGALSRASQARRPSGLMAVAPWLALLIAGIMIVLVIGAFAGFGPFAKKTAPLTSTTVPGQVTQPAPTSVPVVVGEETQAPRSPGAQAPQPTQVPIATNTPVPAEPTRQSPTLRPTRRPTATLAPTSAP